MEPQTASQEPWAEVEAFFPELQVFANVLLSRYGTQSPERFTPFQITRAEANIVSPQTPTTTVGGIAVPSRLDNTVYLKTNRLTFWLAVNNGSSAMPAAYASAVGIIYDTSPASPSASQPSEPASGPSRARTSSWSSPLVATALPPQQPSRPSRDVNRPPASVTTGTSAAMS